MESPTGWTSGKHDLSSEHCSVSVEVGGSTFFCNRQVETNQDRCFWHVEREKNSKEIKKHLNTDSGPLYNAYFLNSRIEKIRFNSRDLTKANFKNAKISGITATFADFNSATFDGCVIEKSKFNNSDFNSSHINDIDCEYSEFYNVSFDGSKLSSASFRDTDLSRADFVDVTCRDSTYTGCKLSKASLSESTWEDTEFENCNLSGAHLCNSLFWYVGLSGKMTGIHFDDTEFVGSMIQTNAGRSADFSGAELNQVDGSGSNFRRATFDSESEIEQSDFSSCDFSNGDLREMEALYTNFSRANLKDADLNDATLEDSVFEGSNLENADFNEAVLTKCNLSSANLFNSDFRGASIYGAIFDNAQIDWNTQFSEQIIDLPGVDSKRARWIHRRLETLYRENESHNQAKVHYKKRKNLQLKEHAENGRVWNPKWWAGFLTKHSSSFAESPRRVIVVSSLVILGFSFLYPLCGGLGGSQPPSPQYIFGEIHLFDFAVPQPVKVFLTSLYFSVSTFTTLTYGDVQPSIGIARFLAASEALIGTLLMAYFLFVLGRKTTQ